MCLNRKCLQKKKDKSGRYVHTRDIYILETAATGKEYEKGKGRSYSDKPTIGEDLSNLENVYLIF